MVSLAEDLQAWKEALEKAHHAMQADEAHDQIDAALRMHL